MEEYEFKKDCFGYRSDASVVRLSRCIAILRTAGFINQKGSSKRKRKKYPFVGTGE